MKPSQFLIVSAALLAAYLPPVMAQQYWSIDPEGSGIVWDVKEGTVHRDHIEMSGKQVSVVLRYGVEKDGSLFLNRSMVWPMLRVWPDNTHSSLMRRFDWNPWESLMADGKKVHEKVESITIDGTLAVRSSIRTGKGGSLVMKRVLFPSVDKPSLLEICELTNAGEQSVSVEIPETIVLLPTEKSLGVSGSYLIHLSAGGHESTLLAPGETLMLSSGISATEDGSVLSLDLEEELEKRRSHVGFWMENLRLDTPDPVVDRMFSLSKIRACESIYETEGGPMHGPGGESYYAAIWANDQAEYINPYFPFVGYAYGNESALNSFRHFARYMNDRWEPVPSSVIAEGRGYWNGAGDRGDAAMIAYGAARYALASGNRDEAEELMPLIRWCLEYCRRKLNDEGVVESDSDELEGRFPAGDANLCTSSLYYDALLSAAFLEKELAGDKSAASGYKKQAETLRKSLNRYFSANVEGYETYRYYDGNTELRSWICIPLAVGIDERREGTLDALFSPRLWTENGLLTSSGGSTFWDRSTLYALRGAFIAGETEKAFGFLKSYSARRLLGEHVPYAIEAWPEGNQRHLSAESGLYGRIITEGMFGIRPVGLHSFVAVPRLPAEWDEMALRRIHAFGGDFDMEIRRVSGDRINVRVTDRGNVLLDKEIREGDPVECTIRQE